MSCSPIAILGKAYPFDVVIKDSDGNPINPVVDIVYKVYEGNNATEILSGLMTTSFDTQVGLCYAQFDCSVANGFSRDEIYKISVLTTISDVILLQSYSFTCFGVDSVVVVPETGVCHFTSTSMFELKLAKLAADNNLEFDNSDKVMTYMRLEAAYQAIEGALIPRGLTRVQISTWSRGEEFQLDIATYWYCKDSGWGGKMEGEVDWTTVFNRIKELEKISIVDNDGILLLNGTGPVALVMDLLDINNKLNISY